MGSTVDAVISQTVVLERPVKDLNILTCRRISGIGSFFLDDPTTVDREFRPRMTRVIFGEDKSQTSDLTLEISSVYVRASIMFSLLFVTNS